MITIKQMIQREVLCCMSSLVSMLAQGHRLPISRQAGPGSKESARALEALTEQASELAAPVLDYEEAATQESWTIEKDDNGHRIFVKRAGADVGLISGADPEDATGWEDLCHKEHLDPYEWEVYEHWAVTQWFAEKLIAQGERVDTDFAGLNIWARTATGQAIGMDGVVQNIYREMVK